MALDIFGPEIRCCLGIDACRPSPHCQKIKCSLGIDSAKQCNERILSYSHQNKVSLPIHSQYKICRERLDQFSCHGLVTTYGKCYSGELRKKYQGQGTLLIYDGDACYDGQFKNGKFHGRGVLAYKDNTIYEGEFNENLRHGQGKMISPAGRIIREGGWINDKYKLD